MKTFKKSEAIRYFEQKLTYTAGPAEVDRLRREEDIGIVDVRRPEDFHREHIPHAVNLPREEWDTLVGLDKGRLNVVYCYTQQCHLAAKACLTFARKGYRVMELEGGWKAWKAYGLDVEGEEAGQKAA